MLISQVSGNWKSVHYHIGLAGLFDMYLDALWHVRLAMTSHRFVHRFVVLEQIAGNLTMGFVSRVTDRRCLD
jgi:hypothetical protein